jgi:hypothetical protein
MKRNLRQQSAGSREANLFPREKLDYSMLFMGFVRGKVSEDAKER